MDKQENVDDIINSSMKNLRDIIDSNTIVGKAIEVDGVYIIPISKVNVGFVAGGGEPGKKKASFLGGSGSGFNVTPVGVLSISKGETQFIQVDRTDAIAELIKTATKVVSSVVGEREDEKNNK